MRQPFLWRLQQGSVVLLSKNGDEGLRIGGNCLLGVEQQRDELRIGKFDDGNSSESTGTHQSFGPRTDAREDGDDAAVVQ